MTMRFEDLQLYYQHTWLIIDDVLSYVTGVTEAESQTNYKVQIQTVQQDGNLGGAKELTSRVFFNHVKPFVPSYGYINYDGFAVLCTLGAYRMARKSFTADRVDFFIPNQAELAKYLKVKRYSREMWLSSPSLVTWLASPVFKTWEEALKLLSEGEAAGVALSQDFALASFLKQDSLHLFYKDLEMGVVDKEGRITLTERGKIFNSFFRSEVKFANKEGIAA